MLPKVSIIVPIFNAEQTIKRCIDSILKQEFTDYELLLVDDGSKDASGALCDQYASRDERIQVFHRENSGVSETRNFALDHARGTYIQFVDADDWITPYATRMFAETAEIFHCDLVIADFYRVSGEHVSHKGAIDYDGVLSREEFASQMMENPADFYYGVLWNKLYRRDIIEKNHLRMDPSISWCEDFMFNLEYIRHCDVFYSLQVPVYYYVKTKGSLVTQGMSLSNTIKMKLMVFEYYNDFYRQVLTEEEYEKKRGQVYRFLIDSATDGIVPPAILSGTKKLGEERLSSDPIAVAGNHFFVEEYHQRKVLDYYLEPLAIKNELTLEEIRVFMHLTALPQCQSFRELADFIGMPPRYVTSILQKLSQKKIVNVTKKRSEKHLCIVFLIKAYPIMEALTAIEEKYYQTQITGFTEAEAKEYERLSKKIKDNIQNVL